MAKILGKYIESSVALAGAPTTSTASNGDNSTKIATTAFVQTAVGLLGEVLFLAGPLDASAIGAQLDNVQSGAYFRATVAGTLFGTNPITLAVGDALICYSDQVGTPDNGNAFFKIDNTELDDQTALEVPVTGAYNSAGASGNVIGGTDNVQSALQKIEKKIDDSIIVVAEIDVNVNDLISLSGVAENAANLGTFTGATIADSSTVKAALQALETEVELKAASSVVSEIDQNVDDLISLSGVAENASDLGTFTGATIADSSTVKSALQALESAHEEVDTNVNDIISLSGVAENAVNLGTFTGATIADSSTIKAALQSLETEVELKANSSVVSEIDQNVNDLISLSGVAENASDLGSFTGATIADASTVKAALQALESAHEEVDANVNDLISLSGVAENAANLGTFTGSIIADSSSVKAALQALETEVELKAASSVVSEIDQNVNDLITLSGVAENASDLGTFTGSIISDNTSVKNALQEVESAIANNQVLFATQAFTLIAGDITNGYVDLSQPAMAGSFTVFPKGGPVQDETVDYTVSLTGGAGGVTRITFAGDLSANLIATDKLIIKFAY